MMPKIVTAMARLICIAKWLQLSNIHILHFDVRKVGYNFFSFAF